MSSLCKSTSASRDRNLEIFSPLSGSFPMKLLQNWTTLTLVLYSPICLAFFSLAINLYISNMFIIFGKIWYP
jgi:hypothetical protein